MIIAIAAIAAATLITRALPFIVFRGDKKTPEIIDYLGRYLPYAIMSMLIVYCLKSVSVIESPHGIPELIAIAFIAAIHKFRHNMLLSIGGGTVLYVVLVNFIFIPR